MAKVSSNCPICGQAHTLEEQYCPRCSWEYRLFPDEVSPIILQMEKEREDRYREIFSRAMKTDDLEAFYKKKVADDSCSMGRVIPQSQ